MVYSIAVNDRNCKNNKSQVTKIIRYTTVGKCNQSLFLSSFQGRVDGSGLVGPVSFFNTSWSLSFKVVQRRLLGWLASRSSVFKLYQRPIHHKCVSIYIIFRSRDTIRSISSSFDPRT